ncbi:MAG: hypothetical protein K5772_04090 [Clostridia bacterium]|nr:hypothetical protein [Clostridia bacterium]
MASGSERLEGKKVSENVYLCPDGIYRWVYEFPMVKNPTILITVWKVLLVSCAICLVLVGVPLLFTDGPESLLGLGKGFGAALLVLLPLSILGYLLVAAAYGGKYMVLFEMDETKVRHIQMEKQVKKAQAMGWLTAMAGLAAGSLSAAGSGLLASSKSVSTSVFADVKQVKADRAMHVIRVNQLLEHNQVYANGADFDFVLNYILDRVPEAAGSRKKDA